MADAVIKDTAQVAVEALPAGTVLLGDQFVITGQLGAGGFGITYHGEDKVLGRSIVIKECFPSDLCGRTGLSVRARGQAQIKPMRSVVSMFMREARSLAKLRHPNIVGVHRAFEENDTAYMVLDLIEGRDLFDIVDDNSVRLSPARVRDILFQLLDAIEEVHKLGLLHRDVSPDNILIETSGKPVLIDFGAARAESSRHSRAISTFMVVKDGYSPQEFYVAGSKQAPCSDLYGLAATFYFLLTGDAPPNSQTRVMDIASGRPDPCAPLVGRVSGYDDAFLAAIDTALSIHPADRLQSASKWRSLIETTRSASEKRAKPIARDVTLEFEMSLSQLVEETNDEVWRASEKVAEPMPVEPPQPVSTQPAWVDEFNRESASRSPNADAQAIGRPEFDDLDMGEIEIWDDALEETMSREPTVSETNWVERALVKQESMRGGQSSALDLHTSEARNLEALFSGAPPSARTQSDMEREAMVTAYSRRPRIRPIGVLLGLLVSLGLVAGLNAVDGSKPAGAAKPATGGLEMKGSIVP